MAKKPNPAPPPATVPRETLVTIEGVTTIVNPATHHVAANVEPAAVPTETPNTEEI